MLFARHRAGDLPGPLEALFLLYLGKVGPQLYLLKWMEGSGCPQGLGDARTEALGGAAPGHLAVCLCLGPYVALSIISILVAPLMS